MRLGEKKILYIRKSGMEKRRISVLVIVIISVIMLIFAGVYFVETVKPVILSNAKSKAHRIAQRAVNDAVCTLFAESAVKSSDVITLVKDSDGKIVAAESNLEGVNLLKARLVTEIQNNILGIDSAEISMPLGAFFGSNIFAGLGPEISLAFMPDGIAEVEFDSKFEDSGINQTKLSVDLKVKTTVGLLIPGMSTDVDVFSTVPIVRTVIAGDVPDSHTYVERDNSEHQEDIFNLLD